MKLLAPLALLFAAAFVCSPPLAYAQLTLGGPTPLPVGSSRTLSAKAVDLHTATGDVATIAIPASITKYQITSVNITNCSVTPVLASVGLYTGAGATGTTLVTAATVTGATSTSVVLASTLAGTVGTTALTATPIYVNLGVANVAALTCDFYVTIRDLT